VMQAVIILAVASTTVLAVRRRRTAPAASPESPGTAGTGDDDTGNGRSPDVEVPHDVEDADLDPSVPAELH
jgi:hypothetical protein